MSNLLEVDNLSVKFKTMKGIANAVRDVSFHIDKGETLGIVGESGCGKSVTARAIMKLHNETVSIVNGKILFQGEDILSKTPKEMQLIRGSKISMIFQDPMTSLNPLIRIGEQIAEVLRYHKKMKKDEARDEAIELLKKVGILFAEERYYQYPHEFSGGMLQRIMIAIALACRPELLIADEPTTALDVTIQAQILELMEKLQKEFDMSILLITHDLGVVAQICTRVCVMYAGRIVEQAETGLLFKKSFHPYTEGLISAIPESGSRGKRLNTIEGVPPDSTGEIKGCAFSPRCRYAKEECSLRSPSLREIEPGHFAACHYSEKLTLEGE